MNSPLPLVPRVKSYTVKFKLLMNTRTGFSKLAWDDFSLAKINDRAAESPDKDQAKGICGLILLDIPPTRGLIFTQTTNFRLFQTEKVCRRQN